MKACKTSNIYLKNQLRHDNDFLVLIIFSVDAQNLCGSDKCEKKLNIFVPIVCAISSLLVLLIVLIIIWRVRRNIRPGTALSDNITLKL